jgi:hypothetical protein
LPLSVEPPNVFADENWNPGRAICGFMVRTKGIYDLFSAMSILETSLVLILSATS